MQPGLDNREVEVSLEAAAAILWSGAAWQGKWSPTLGSRATCRGMHTQCAQCRDRTQREWWLM